MKVSITNLTKEDLEKFEENRVPDLCLANNDYIFDEEIMNEMLETAKERGPLIVKIKENEKFDGE